MITVTEKKKIEEVIKSLDRCQKVYLIGCGTCATLLHTGGKTEVLEMKQQLEATGKKVTGWMVIPTACDTLTKEALDTAAEEIKGSDCLLVLTCGFGVQMVSQFCDKAVYPALDTMFVGREEGPGVFSDVCMQCGSCVLSLTGGICPVVRCAKGLLNGPCGGSVGGKCEVSTNTPCAWQLIIDRLAACGQLDKLEEVAQPKDWSASRSGGPRRITVEA